MTGTVVMGALDDVGDLGPRSSILPSPGPGLEGAGLGEGSRIGLRP